MYFRRHDSHTFLSSFFTALCDLVRKDEFLIFFEIYILKLPYTNCIVVDLLFVYYRHRRNARINFKTREIQQKLAIDNSVQGWIPNAKCQHSQPCSLRHSQWECTTYESIHFNSSTKLSMAPRHTYINTQPRYWGLLSTSLLR